MFAPLLALGIAAGVTLSPTAPTTTISLSDANRQTCGLVVRNDTDRPVQIWLAAFWPNHRMTMKDASGKPVGLTSFGKAATLMFGGGRDKNSPLTIEPGKSYKYPTQSLVKTFELRPGGYTLSVVYEDKSFGKPLRLNCSMRVKVVK